MGGYICGVPVFLAFLMVILGLLLLEIKFPHWILAINHLSSVLIIELIKNHQKNNLYLNNPYQKSSISAWPDYTDLNRISKLKIKKEGNFLLYCFFRLAINPPSKQQAAMASGTIGAPVLCIPTVLVMVVVVAALTTGVMVTVEFNV